jgi:methyltransferase (TIGR00027 family)
MDDEERLASVGATAVTVAVCRAAEGRRPQPWFVDPIAEHVERIAETAPEQKVGPGLVFWLAVRTRFLDELLADATSNGIDQIVLLGAGLDARAFRLDWPAGTRLFEVDRASVIALKDRLVDELRLQPRCDRRTVVADLGEPDWLDALAAQGWQSERSTCWIAEGLFVYLDDAGRDALLRELASVGNGRLGATFTSAQRAAQVELFSSGVDGDALALLAQVGWNGVVKALPEVAASYGRPIMRDSSRASSALLVDAVTRS